MQLRTIIPAQAAGNDEARRTVPLAALDELQPQAEAPAPLNALLREIDRADRHQNRTG